MCYSLVWVRFFVGGVVFFLFFLWHIAGFGVFIVLLGGVRFFSLLGKRLDLYP